MNEVTQTIVLDFINAEDLNKRERARYMAMNARTSIMMYKATKDRKYLEQAKKEVEIGKDILRGFTRPLGCTIFTKAA